MKHFLQKNILYIKVTIVLLSLLYLVLHVSGNLTHEITFIFRQIVFGHTYLFLLVLILMPFNWITEALKWKTITNQFYEMSVQDAVKSVLAGLSIGTATPNRIGEFAGKVLFLPESMRLGAIGLNMVCSFYQVGITVLMGVPCGFLLQQEFLLKSNGALLLSFVTGGIVLLLLLLLLLRKQIEPLTELMYLLNIQTMLKTGFYAVLRYFIYVSQFVLLLYIILPDVELIRLFEMVCWIYFIITALPTFAMTELIVRGSVAAYVAEMSGFPAVYGLAASFVLWVINIAFPSLAGLYFIVRLKSIQK